MDREPTWKEDLAWLSGWAAWQTIRIPIAVILQACEPIVRLLLSAASLLGVLTALLFRAVGPPQFPFWRVLGLSVGFGLLLAAYQALVRLVSR